MILATEKNHYALMEVVSALQKTIRRGLEREAMYWSLELVPRYERYLWQRLLTITHEDVGLGNPLALSVIPAMRDTYFEFRNAGRDGSARLVLANAITLLCRSSKSRLADHLQCITVDARERGEMKLQIPDYAIDRHTIRGTKLGRDMQHWLTQGCTLVPEAAPEFRIYQTEAEERWKRGVVRMNMGKKGAEKPTKRHQIPEQDNFSFDE